MIYLNIFRSYRVAKFFVFSGALICSCIYKTIVDIKKRRSNRFSKSPIMCCTHEERYLDSSRTKMDLLVYTLTTIKNSIDKIGTFSYGCICTDNNDFPEYVRNNLQLIKNTIFSKIFMRIHFDEYVKSIELIKSEYCTNIIKKSSEHIYKICNLFNVIQRIYLLLKQPNLNKDELTPELKLFERTVFMIGHLLRLILKDLLNLEYYLYEY